MCLLLSKTSSGSPAVNTVPQGMSIEAFRPYMRHRDCPFQPDNRASSEMAFDISPFRKWIGRGLVAFRATPRGHRAGSSVCLIQRIGSTLRSRRKRSIDGRKSRRREEAANSGALFGAPVQPGNSRTIHCLGRDQACSCPISDRAAWDPKRRGARRRTD
jgi:hypothetical protein